VQHLASFLQSDTNARPPVTADGGATRSPPEPVSLAQPATAQEPVSLAQLATAQEPVSLAQLATAQEPVRGSDGPAHERALLLRLKRSDPEAQAAVFEMYEAAVRRVLTRILRDDSDVADALQDTFVKVFRSASQVQEPEALRGWVLCVAETVGLDAFRRRQRVRARTADAADCLEMSVKSPPFDVRRALLDAYRVLSILPQEEQRVLTLRRIDGLELSSIAAECDVSLATVKRRLVRASTRFEALARRQPSLSEWVGAE
jgi:RNA polymerase sigma-70 factor (ECF subfamily)